jgi:hypothetical protein
MDFLKEGIIHQGKVDPRALAAFKAGQGWLASREEETIPAAYMVDEALSSFERALEFQPDFTDAHLWIARLTDDRQTRQDHMDAVLKQNPDHPEVKRLLRELGRRKREKK